MGNLLGKVIKILNNARWEAQHEAKNDLWKRNGLDNPTQRNGYRMAETQKLLRDGTEVMEYRLYKLLDASRVIVKANVTHEIETGIWASDDKDEPTL